MLKLSTFDRQTSGSSTMLRAQFVRGRSWFCVTGNTDG